MLMLNKKFSLSLSLTFIGSQSCSGKKLCVRLAYILLGLTLGFLKKTVLAIGNANGIIIEYLNSCATFNFEVYFRRNGAISTNVSVFCHTK